MAALNNVQLSFFYDRPFQTFGHNSNWLCPRIEKKERDYYITVLKYAKDTKWF